MPNRTGFLRILAVVGLCLPDSVAANVSADQIRKAAEKAVTLLQSSQNKWNQDCFSCHHQALPPVAFQAAREHGIHVDEALAHVSAARLPRSLKSPLYSSEPWSAAR